MRMQRGSIAAGAVLLATALTLTGAWAAPAEAAGKARSKYTQRAQIVPERPRQPPASQRAETMDDIRANAQDPAGNYKDFPSWARAAFTNFPRD